MSMFHEGQRALQDRWGGRRVADRIVELVESDAVSDEFRGFIESLPFFFLATAAEGVADCSFKGGAPGFVRVPDPKTILFPDYDGNRMYRSLGNIERDPAVGLLFMRFGAEEGEGALYLRVRVNGRARILEDDPRMADWPGALRLVEVAVEHVYPNCPRYVPHMQMIEPSRHVPRAGEPQPVPAWKEIPPIAEGLDE